jgi:hypothetical protein
MKIVYVGILFALVLALVVFIFSYTGGAQQANTPEQSCISSGGTVTSAMCCGSASDFPNTCLIGACGCSPSNSHSVKTCDCGANMCFNGTRCVSQALPGLGTSAGNATAGTSVKFDISIQNFTFVPPTANIQT